MIKPIVLITLLSVSSIGYSQSNSENSRISELYDLLSNESKSSKKEVRIYDYKISGRKVQQDSSLITRLSLLPEDQHSNFEYDTVGLEVVQFNMKNGKRTIAKKFLLDSEGRIIESSLVNEQLKPLSKIFYTYENNHLVKEESYTGYAYLDEPRKLSLITYEYDNDHLSEREKKYSLNGTHWIQTWTYKYDSLGNKIWVEERYEDNTTIYENEFEDGRLVRSVITLSDGKVTIKEIQYDTQGFPVSVYKFHKKNNKPQRFTKFYYQ